MSIRLVAYAAFVGTLVSLSLSAQVRPGSTPRLPAPRQTDSFQRTRLAGQNQRTLDPVLGRVPAERLNASRQQIASSANGRLVRADTATWAERGPLGLTGTLRTLLADPTDPLGRRLWAGSTTGGLWVNQNVTALQSRWLPVGNTWHNQTVSALAADPANGSTLYAATGDAIENREGGGIWKSTDRGQTWLHLPATTPAQSGTSVQTAFRYMSALAVTTTGVLLVATNEGVVRSADQGQTWQLTLAPQQQIGGQPVTNGNDRMTAVGTGRDGLVYAALATGRLFRSTTTMATAWTDITPPDTAPYAGIRTELSIAAPASGTAQVLYAAQIAGSTDGGGYTLRWLQKSINNGQTWQAMTRPTYPDVPDVDVTLGFGDQYFSLTAAPDSVNVVYLTAYDRMYRSGDGGQTWSEGAFIGRTTAFLPLGSSAGVWGSDSRIYYASQQQIGDNQGLVDPQYDRSNGFNGLVVAGVAMPNTAGHTYRLTGSAGEPGLLEITGSGSSSESVQVTFPAYPLRPFIDQNEPNIQVATTTNGGFLTRNLDYSTGWDYFSAGWGAGDYPDGGVDYDSRSNTLFFWSDGYMRATGIGVSPLISPLSSVSLTRPTCLKIGMAPNTLFAATANGGLYKLAQTNTASPVLTRLDRGAFPAGSTISGIDVGKTDSLLIVTLANYGVASVWYTTNAGVTWQNKDTGTSGLPDMPVYAVVLNPTDRRRVMLATELGVWATNDITAANPNWALTNAASTTLTMPLIRCTQLTCRPTDGRVAVATAGRGVWETDAWALAPPALLAGPLTSSALCAGTTFPVAFTLTNATASQILLRLSDAAGNFSQGTVLASGISSPLSATIAADRPAGSGYRLRLELPALGLTTPVGNSVVVTNLTLNRPRLLDRRQGLDARLPNEHYFRGYVCSGDSALLRADLPGHPANLPVTYQWAADGQVLTDQTAATLLTGNTGLYSFTVTTGGCTATNADDLLLTSDTRPDLSVLTSAQAGDGPICPGATVPLGITYLGRRGTYQWLRNELAIPGATSPVFSATATGAYSYSLTVSLSGTGTAGTCAATVLPTYLTFSRAILPPPIAVTNDVLPTLCGAESLGLYATQQPDNTTYQWLRNGQPAVGESSPFLTVNQAGLYSLRVMRGTCTAVSNPVSVTGNSQLSNGFYFYGSTTLCTGETLVLYAKNGQHTLQWTKNDVPISGATGFSYPVTTSGQYGLRYTSGGCSGTAVSISVVVSQTLNPALLVTEQCTNADLSIRAYPQTGQVAFSWFRNGLLAGQGPQAYLTVTESGVYSVSVTNGVCGGLSKPVSVSIGRATKPIIQAIGSTVRCPDSAVKIERVSGPGSYWKRNGIALAGLSADVLVAHEAGVYALVYQQGTCLAESLPVTVVINQPVTATVAVRPFIRSGQSAVVPIQLGGGGPWSFSVVGMPGLISTAQNPYSLTLTPARSTSYSLVSLANGCGTGTGATWRIVVDGADVSLSSWVNKRSVQVGDLVTYSVRVTNAGPDAAEAVTLIDRLPPGLSFAGSQSTVTADTLRHRVGNMSAGQSVMLIFQVRVNRQGKYQNAVEVIGCNTPDPDSQPDTGTADGQDDAAQTDLRTTDTTQMVFRSPNPRARPLPAVASHQPLPASGKADLSLLLFLNKQVLMAQRRDTIRVTVQVSNRGGASTSAVQASLTVPNGTYSLDGLTWKTSTIVSPVDMGLLGSGQTISRTVLWLPTASGSCRAEVTRSSLPDPDSTPNNRGTRPGEDDEAAADVRVIR